MDTTQLIAFSFSYLLIAISPGLCMTLALSLGISIGVRLTLWMMLGEVIGVAMVGAAALGGVGSLMLSAPGLFDVAKILAAAYLLRCAWVAWRAPCALSQDAAGLVIGAKRLVSQGFVTAVSNPKGWVFSAALLPPFLDPQSAFLPQASSLLAVMIVLEFLCMLLYAHGGRVLRDSLVNRGLGQWLNRISASLMGLVACWLLLS